MLGSKSPHLSVIFSNYVSLQALHGTLANLLREEGKNVNDLHELGCMLVRSKSVRNELAHMSNTRCVALRCVALRCVGSVIQRDVTSAYSQYAMERSESRQVLRANPSLLPPNGTVADLNAALDQPIEYFSQYPRLLQALMNTISVSSTAYCAFAFMLADIYRILRQINVKPAPPRGAHEELCDNSRIQTIDVQLLFDWHDLPNTPNDLAAPDRTLIKTAVFRKTHTPKNQREQPREIVYHAFLFNDVLMIGRPSPTIDKLWFKAIFPLDKLIVWDVPDRHGTRLLDWMARSLTLTHSHSLTDSVRCWRE